MAGSRPIALIVGVGPATGQTLCRRLAGNYELVMVARSQALIGTLAKELPDAHAYSCDVADQTAWPTTLAQIVREVGMPWRVLVNTESASWGDYNELPIARFAESFSVNAVGFLQLVQTLFPNKQSIPADTRVVVSSSPAAYNPPPAFLGLAPSRVAQRVMAELLNESLAESGLRFSVFSIDGAIDEPKMRAMLPGKPTSYFIQPDDIAAELARLFVADDFPIASGITGESSFSRR